MTILNVATFNREWRTSASSDAGIIPARLLALDPHITCLTEAYRAFFGDQGHVIEADADYAMARVVRTGATCSSAPRQPMTL